MTKRILTIFAIVFFLLLLRILLTTDKYQLRVRFLPGEYTLKILNNTHIKRDDEMVVNFSSEESWNIIALPGKHPEMVSLELNNKVISYQQKFHYGLLDVYYDGDQPLENMTRFQSLLAGPKIGTKLQASFLNDFQKIGNIKVIEQGDPNDAFKKMYFHTFGVINNIHALLPKNKVKVGDSWQMPIIKPLAFEYEISGQTGGICCCYV